MGRPCVKIPDKVLQHIHSHQLPRYCYLRTVKYKNHNAEKYRKNSHFYMAKYKFRKKNHELLKVKFRTDLLEKIHI